MKAHYTYADVGEKYNGGYNASISVQPIFDHTLTQWPKSTENFMNSLKKELNITISAIRKLKMLEYFSGWNRRECMW